MILQNNNQATARLLAGGVGVLATDTLYGLVARAADKQAVAKLYVLKQREQKPGTVIAASVEQLVDLGVDKKYIDRIKKWWPGSISIETPLGPHLAYLHQNTGRQGFRVVADERVRRILEQTGPLVTSSANLPGEPPANTINQAYQYFKDRVDFYVDSGDRSGQPPSTIARITDRGIEIIRQGAVVIPSKELAMPAARPDCPFCLANNLLKTSILFQDSELFITQPMEVPGAYLIIPKIHTEQLTDLPDTWWRAVKKALRYLPLPSKAAYNVSINYGKVAGQRVAHLHFWVVLRQSDTPSSGMGLAALVKAVDVHVHKPL